MNLDTFEYTPRKVFATRFIGGFDNARDIVNWVKEHEGFNASWNGNLATYPPLEEDAREHSGLHEHIVLYSREHPNQGRLSILPGMWLVWNPRKNVFRTYDSSDFYEKFKDAEVGY